MGEKVESTKKFTELDETLRNLYDEATKKFIETDEAIKKRRGDTNIKGARRQDFTRTR